MTVAVRDLTSLAWCLAEIRESLARAEAGLEMRLHDSNALSDAAGRPASSWLHQAHGALRFVELDGVAVLMHQAEQLVARIERGELLLDAPLQAVLVRAFAATLDYLEAVCAGSTESPVALYPHYRELMAAQGAERVEPADLYVPDLSPQPAALQRLAHESLSELQAERLKAAFERGLLGFLRNPADQAALQAMHDTAVRMQRAHAAPSSQRYWWLASAFIDALANGALQPDLHAKRQVARLQQHLRRDATQAVAVTGRMTAELLFLLARSGSGSQAADEARALFGLDGTVPSDFEVPRYGLIDARSLREAREATTQTKAAWERFVRGAGAELPDFAGSAQQLEVALTRLPLPGLRDLAGALCGLRRTLATAQRGLIEAIALDVASALLFIEWAIEHDAAPPPEADARALELARRIEALARDPAAVHAEQTSPAWLNDLSRTAQERLTTAAFIAELRVNLNACEQALDAFFRDPMQREGLPAVCAGLAQVSGALRLLGYLEAAHGADTVASAVSDLSLGDAPSDPQAFERIAHSLGALGFFVESLQRADAGAGGFRFSQGVDGFSAQLAPRGDQPSPLPQSPTASSVGGAAPSGEGIDLELLGIFLDEADEVLQTIESDRVMVELSPGDSEALAAIRRGFHTLKGSSRMVGLHRFGEAAWALEQTLNGWLALGQMPDAQGLALLAQAQRALREWVRQLRINPSAAVDVDGLCREAARLRSDGAVPTHLDLIDLRAAGLSAPVRLPEPTEPDPIDLSSLEWDALPDRLSPETAVLAEPDAEAPVSHLPVYDVPPGHPTATDAPTEDESSVRIGARTVTASLYSLFLAESDAALESISAFHQTFGAESLAPDAAGALEAEAAAHRLVGNARLLGLPQVAELAGLLEDVYRTLARDAQTIDASRQATLNSLLDGLRALLHQFAAGREPVIDPALRVRAQALREAAQSSVSAPGDEPEAEGSVHDEIDVDLLGLFVAEADELMPQIGEALQRWRAQPLDRSPMALLMRALHTVKGSARMAGAMRLGQALHEIETRIERAPADSPVDQVLALVDELIASHDEALTLYESLRVGPVSQTSTTPVLADPGLRDEAVAVATGPLSPTSLTPAETSASTPSLVRVRADLLDRLVNEAGEVSISRARLDNELAVIRQSMGELAENVARLRLQLREIELAADSRIQSRDAHSAQLASDASIGPDPQEVARREAGSVGFDPLEFDPLEFDRYTRLQELTRMLAESVNDVATVHHNALRGLDEATRDLALQAQVTRELQQDLMRIRMVRFGSIADRLHRVVRQSAAECERQARLELTGIDTEVDRSVLERMAGPMEHLLRNAVAHGIEAPDARVQAGKSPQGVVSVQVRQDGHALIITLADDGAGLDLTRIHRAAIERGLIGADASPSERDLSQLIFLPGFTTASSLSTLAGRGVGLDAVRAEVSAMGGRIELQTTAGQGTRFVAYLPVSLAVTQVVALSAGSTQVAVPSNLVEQLMHLQPEPIAQAYAQHALTLSDATVPLYYLGSLLELPGVAPQAQRLSPVVLLRSGSQRIALHVDHVAPSQEVVVKPIGPQLSRLTGMAGATVLGNGQIVLILDPVQIAATGRSVTAGQGDTASFAPSGTDVTPTVMVVDDSVTVRKVTQRLLVRESYQVLLARDGLDALRQLQDTVPDAMLLDIEMPRMDGFELVAQMHADARWRDVPIIMISSRTAEKHRAHALKLGVQAFLGKPFDETELLGQLRTLTARRRPGVPPST